jgi:hypothetical protein
MLTGVSERAEWRGQRDTGSRRLWTWLLVSSLLHAPLTPLMALLGLVGLLQRNEQPEGPPAPPITEIPIDLLNTDEPGPGAKPAERAKPAEQSEPAAVAPREPKRAPEQRPDAELTDGGSEAPDAGLGDAAPAAEANQPRDGGGTRGAGEGIGDPVALSGAAGKIADARANIQLILYTERMRKHPLGPRVGRMLGQAYQWRDFLGPSGLDPIHDIDRILIAGPELRDSSEVVAVLHYNVSEERMHGAIDTLVQRDRAGEWLDAGAPAARARADRAERLFVFPAPHLVVVTPPSAAKHALSLGPKTSFRKAAGDEVLIALVVKPAQAVRGLPFQFPDSIKWLRLKLTPTEDHGASLTVVARDGSAELAAQNAELLEQTITAMTRLDLGLLGSLLGRRETRFVETIEFESEGQEIRGELFLTAQQLGTLVELLSQFMVGRVERPRPAQPAEDAAALPAAPDTPPAEPGLTD